VSEPAYHIILSPEAGADIEAIHEFIGKTSPQNAAAMVGRILDAITSLETFPHRNVVEHRSDKIAHAVRSLVVRPYIVYFRVLDPQRAVRILSVQHGARRRPSHFT
jgi:toxin ParE1/3/4